MELKRFFDDDDAVSPVIGVILMVAITVILAAVIATFVLGLGDSVSNTAPQASFSFDYDDSADELKITHDGGDSINANELYVRGSNLNSETGAWNSADVDGSVGSGSKVRAGNSATLDSITSNQYEVRVVFQSQEGDTSATLAQDEGPDA